MLPCNRAFPIAQYLLHPKHWQQLLKFRWSFVSREDKSERIYLPDGPNSSGNPCEVNVRSLSASKLSEFFRNSGYCEANFTHVDSLNGIFANHEQIGATWMAATILGWTDYHMENEEAVRGGTYKAYFGPSLIGLFFFSEGQPLYPM